MLEHAMKIIEKVLGRIWEVVNVDAMQLSFVPGLGTKDALFVAEKKQEENKDNKKLHMSFFDILESF